MQMLQKPGATHRPSAVDCGRVSAPGEGGLRHRVPRAFLERMLRHSNPIDLLHRWTASIGHPDGSSHPITNAPVSRTIMMYFLLTTSYLDGIASFKAPTKLGRRALPTLMVAGWF